MTDQNNNIFEWVIGANLAEVDQICNELAIQLIAYDLGEHFFPIQMLARESLNNAVIHGSSQDASKKILFQLTLDQEQITIFVNDEGSGFDWESKFSEGLPESVQTNGRGLWVYRLFADRIVFNKTGNAVMLTRLIKREQKKSKP